ncbi:MAG: peptidylprolyl isomerase [Dehalococcoidales bacterium]|nr:peptidylprolyl isomerase [Dehalococcoidales bacterium]
MKILRVIPLVLILLVTFLPACSGKTTSVPMSNYVNEIVGFAVDYPQNWTTDQSSSYRFLAGSPDTAPASGTFNNKAGIIATVSIALTPEDSISLETRYHNFYNQLLQAIGVSEFEEISAGNTTFGQNISGYAGNFKFTDNVGDWDINCYISEVHGSYCYYYYIIWTYSLIDSSKSNESILASVLDSFRYVNITVTPTAPKKHYDAAPPMTIDINKQYTVTMTTVYGDMVFQLFPIDAPQTVNNFIFLAREGYFDDTVFHRVIDNFVVQGGDPTGTGMGNPGYYIPDEISSRQHLAGTLSMANSGAGTDTNGSQFFICYVDQPSLNGSHSVFGQLVQGTDVLNKIQKNDRLIKVTIEEK